MHETNRPLSTGETADDVSSDRAGGELNAAISRAVVRAYHGSAGRGPTKAHSFFRGNVVVVVLEDVMTTAERTLAESGRGEAVAQARRELHSAIRTQLVAAVENLTGRRVDAVMNDVSLEPDMAVEVFVLDESVLTKPSGASPVHG